MARLAASHARMRPRQREVLSLAAVAELTVPEIAEARVMSSPLVGDRGKMTLRAWDMSGK